VGDTIVSVPVLVGLASTDPEPVLDALLEHAVATSAISAIVTLPTILRLFRIAIGKHTPEHTPRR
jgi:predicted TIM-barrel enzyme